jgi:6-phosphogluconolactonase
MCRVKILNFIAIALAILFMNACSSPTQEYLVYVGTYTGTGGEGIYAYRFNPTSGALNSLGLMAKTDNPSFLALDADGKFLYAVNELDSFQGEASGALSVFSINKETAALKLLQQIPSLGAAPCHVSLDKSGKFLLVANYNGGNAAVFPISGDGTLGTQTAFIQNSGSSVNADRQAAAHAHFIQVTNDNKFAMIADLGIDQVIVQKFDSNTGALSALDSGFVRMIPGSGPRHLAYAPDGKFVYVLNELTSAIAACSFESETGAMKTIQTISTLPDNFSGSNTTAEIAIDTQGKFLFASNRGDDTIAIYSIDNNTGKLTFIERISTGGKTPRHFEIDPTGQWLIAANQNSDNMVLFKIDHTNGRLVQTSVTSGISAPVCVRFLPAHH